MSAAGVGRAVALPQLVAEPQKPSSGKVRFSTGCCIRQRHAGEAGVAAAQPLDQGGAPRGEGESGRAAAQDGRAAAGTSSGRGAADCAQGQDAGGVGAAASGDVELEVGAVAAGTGRRAPPGQRVRVFCCLRAAFETIVHCVFVVCTAPILLQQASWCHSKR